MLQEVLNSPLINVSAIADQVGIRRQTLHEYRRNGTGISHEKLREICNYLQKEFLVLMEYCKVEGPDKSKGPVKSQVEEVSSAYDMVSGRIRVTPAEYERLPADKKKLYVPYRNAMGSVFYKLNSEVI